MSGISSLTAIGNGLAANDGTGDALRAGADKINGNNTAIVTAVNNLAASQSAGMISYLLKSDMDADLAHADGVLATVTNDPTDANNAVYRKSGASGAGSWSVTIDRATIVKNDLASTAAGKGASLVGFLQAGTGSIVQDVNAKLLDQPASMGDKSYPPYTGANDLQAAFAELVTLGKPVKLVNGTYGIGNGPLVTGYPLSRRAGIYIATGDDFELSGNASARVTLQNLNSSIEQSVIFGDGPGNVSIKNVDIFAQSSAQDYRNAIDIYGANVVQLDDISTSYSGAIKAGASSTQLTDFLYASRIRCDHGTATWDFGTKSGGAALQVVSDVYSSNGRSGVSIEAEHLGNTSAISSMTYSSPLVTATTAAAHGLTTGDVVSIQGATQEEYNSAFSVTVTGTSSFTFKPINAPTVTPATGTITFFKFIGTVRHANYGLIHVENANGALGSDDTQVHAVKVEDGVDSAHLGHVRIKTGRSAGTGTADALAVNTGQQGRAATLVVADVVEAIDALGAVSVAVGQIAPQTIIIGTVYGSQVGGLLSVLTALQNKNCGTVSTLIIREIIADTVVNPSNNSLRANVILIDNGGVSYPNIVDTLIVEKMNVTNIQTALAIRNVRKVVIGPSLLKGFNSFASGQFYVGASVWIQAAIIELTDVNVYGGATNNMYLESTDHTHIRGGSSKNAIGAGLSVSGAGNVVITDGWTSTDDRSSGKTQTYGVARNSSFTGNLHINSSCDLSGNSSGPMDTNNSYGTMNIEAPKGLFQTSFSWTPGSVTAGSSQFLTVNLPLAGGNGNGITWEITPPTSLLGLSCQVLAVTTNQVKLYIYNYTSSPITGPTGTWRMRGTMDNRA